MAPHHTYCLFGRFSSRSRLSTSPSLILYLLVVMSTSSPYPSHPVLCSSVQDRSYPSVPSRWECEKSCVVPPVRNFTHRHQTGWLETDTDTWTGPWHLGRSLKVGRVRDDPEHGPWSRKPVPFVPWRTFPRMSVDLFVTFWWVPSPCVGGG